MRLEEIPLTMTVEEAGALLGLSRSSAYVAAKRGELPTVRLGGRMYVPRGKLLELLGYRPSDARASAGAN